jgi:hypothetical protein
MTDCVTYHYDQARTGWFQGGNTRDVSKWGKIQHITLGSPVRGAPLFLEHWAIARGAHAGETHSLVFVATSDNHIFAYDIDQLFAGQANFFWSQTLRPAILRSGSNIPKPIGICDTPVIDPSPNNIDLRRMFVLAYQDEGHGTQLDWSKAGNTSGFGDLLDGNHAFWIGNFSGAANDEILFHYNGDGNWWLGTYESVNGNPAQLNWVHLDNTGGFGGNNGIDYGDLLDGRHSFFTGDFSGSGRTQMLFYSAGGTDNPDGNWWLRGFAKPTYHITAHDIDTGAILDDARLFDIGAHGRPRFDAGLQDQRGALNLVNGWIYATFADFYADDAGPYHGWVVGCNARNLKDQKFFPVTINGFGGGVWGPGGVAAAPDGSLYFSTGNWTGDVPSAEISGGKHPPDFNNYFEAVVRLDGSSSVQGPSLQVKGWYMPASAPDALDMNANDKDLGGSSVLVLPRPAGEPKLRPQMLVTTGKSGDVFLLDELTGPHWGGALWRKEIFPGYPNDGESKCAPAYYRSRAGDEYVYVIGSSKGKPGLVALRLTSNGVKWSLEQKWSAVDKFGNVVELGDIPGSPVVMSTPGTPNEAVVWIVDDNDIVPALRAFDALSLNEVYSSSDQPNDKLEDIPHFPPITCAQSIVFVGTNTGFACYGPPKLPGAGR